MNTSDAPSDDSDSSAATQPSGYDLGPIAVFVQHMHQMGARTVKVGNVVVHFAELPPAPGKSARKRTDADILEHSA